MSSVRILWTAAIGLTSPRTTMALVGSTLLVGSHGRARDRANEREDGVHVLDARTGVRQRILSAPGAGDRDVGGLAVDGETVYFGTHHGYVVATSIKGDSLWATRLAGPLAVAPALADVTADGQVDVLVGDGRGRVHALEGRSGRVLWSASVAKDRTAPALSVSIAVADVDGDGIDDVLAGATDGTVQALRGRDGALLWTYAEPSSLRGEIVLADVDDDQRPELLVAWTEGTVAALDSATGKVLWSQRVEHDDGQGAGLLGAPVPVPGPHVGALLVPTARGTNTDGIVVVGQHERAYRWALGRVRTSAVVTSLTPDGPPDAIFGTVGGDLVAVDAQGAHSYLASLKSPIEATPLLGDVDQNGTREILVASLDGTLTCFTTSSAAVPVISRHRGSLHNRGDLGRIPLGWAGFRR